MSRRDNTIQIECEVIFNLCRHRGKNRVLTVKTYYFKEEYVNLETWKVGNKHVRLKVKCDCKSKSESEMCE